MKRNDFLLWMCLFSASAVFSQQKILNGTILVTDGVPSGVHIVNVSNEKEVVSDNEGHFSIAANVDDVLVLSAEKLEFQRVMIDQKQFDQGKLEVRMLSKPTQLDEVEVVRHDKLNAVDLGILQKPAKTYTPAERRLRTAGDFKPYHLLGIIAGGMELDPIINAINGKTKRLKKAVKQEKKELLMARISESYADDFFIQDLKIPADYITGFKYYLAEDADFVQIFETGNPERIGIEMARKATDFNAARTAEKK